MTQLDMLRNSHTGMHLVAGAEKEHDTLLSISHTDRLCVCASYLAPASPVYERQNEANACQKDCDKH